MALGQQPTPVSHKPAALGNGQREHIPGAFRQLCQGKRMCIGQQLRQLPSLHSIPALERHPVTPRHIGRRDHALVLDQLGIALRPGAEAHHRPALSVHADDREHLAANSLVAHPEDEPIAPLNRLLDMSELADDRAHSLRVHNAEIIRV